MRRNEEFAGGAARPPLSESEKRILDFGKRDWPHFGARDNAIYETFGYSPTTYFLKMTRLLDHPEAVSYAPDVVSRMNRIKETGHWGSNGPVARDKNPDSPR